jgi:hypothetical protein
MVTKSQHQNTSKCLLKSTNERDMKKVGFKLHCHGVILSSPRYDQTTSNKSRIKRRRERRNIQAARLSLSL